MMTVILKMNPKRRRMIKNIKMRSQNKLLLKNLQHHQEVRRDYPQIIPRKVLKYKSQRNLQKVTSRKLNLMLMIYSDSEVNLRPKLQPLVGLQKDGQIGQHFKVKEVLAQPIGVHSKTRHNPMDIINLLHQAIQMTC